jgi:cytochrome c oxidase subunit 1
MTKVAQTLIIMISVVARNGDAPADAQQQDSYFVIAHFHYVLIGGSMFALLAGIHFWFPLMFGRKIGEFWGKLSFWVIFAGFNITFFPMHFLGLNGMPRRTFTYDGNLGWNSANYIATVGALILGVGIFIYFAVMVYTYFKGEKVGKDVWDARTLEWSLPNPPPEYNYRVIPTVHARDAFWYMKQNKEQIAKEDAAHAKEEAAHGGIHMPHQSIYPFVASLGMLIAGIGISVIDSDPTPGFWGKKIGVTMIGGVVMLAGIYFWALEGNGGYHLHPENEGDESNGKKPAKH